MPTDLWRPKHGRMVGILQLLLIEQLNGLLALGVLSDCSGLVAKLEAGATKTNVVCSSQGLPSCGLLRGMVVPIVSVHACVGF